MIKLILSISKMTPSPIGTVSNVEYKNVLRCISCHTFLLILMSLVSDIEF